MRVLIQRVKSASVDESHLPWMCEKNDGPVTILLEK